ncbi:hypothetical protein [Pleionea litopenaei]|uniref:Uncharacterized protein n=1 Tax=Pleionea litopenaei TaxID=3070815 RepID=A0AA51RTL4_9GAMM|nr:hypothetical protein [Pleionea sp. HL-JVS1]WMS87244.1 hypothetical protein Q9312_18725 [Pleionea sp. HL-JVS1]
MRLLVAFLIAPTLSFAFDVNVLTLDNINEIENPYQSAMENNNGSDMELVKNYTRFETCRGIVVENAGRMWSMEKASKRGETKQEIMDYHSKTFEGVTQEEIEMIGALKAAMEAIELAYEYKDNQEAFPKAAMAKCLKIEAEKFL